MNERPSLRAVHRPLLYVGSHRLFSTVTIVLLCDTAISTGPALSTPWWLGSMLQEYLGLI